MKELDSSSLIWKGYNTELQLDMSVHLEQATETEVCLIVQLIVPNVGTLDSHQRILWDRDSIQEAISSGEFEKEIARRYIEDMECFCLDIMNSPDAYIQ